MANLENENGSLARPSAFAFGRRKTTAFLSGLLSTVLATASTNPPPRLRLDDSPLKSEVKASTSFAPVAKRVAPSVVNIYSTMTIRESRMSNPLSDDPFLRRFFGGDDSQDDQPRSRRAQGLGSGVIVSPEGYILTANHVVEGADKVKVALSSGEKEFDAKIIGTDPPTDIAVLKIEPKVKLEAITIGDSDKLEVGDTVLALGNPFGVGRTVTMGIVSGLSRSGFGINAYEDFIQTDAAINMGNSGGALVDSEGRLIGINTAILSRSGGFQGVGFAVPINLARFVMDRIISEGKVTRGYLGVSIQPLTAGLAKGLGLPDESSGVLVGGVTPNSAAEKAGIKDGDVVLDFNGKKVTDPASLQIAVAQTPPGTKANLRVLRPGANGKPTEKDVSVKLAELPHDIFSRNDNRGRHEQGQSTTDALDGVQVADLDSNFRRQFDLPRSVHGAVVAKVDPDSNAAESGLRPGDVILEINRQEVRTADDAVNDSEKAKGDQILLRVWSSGGPAGQGGTRYVVVDNTKHK
jgi:serine protease Do